jgi:probable HAF family extracellular repeat protein
MKLLPIAVLVLFSTGVGFPDVVAGADSPRYRVTDLGELVEAVALNDSGEVVGNLQLPDHSYHAFLFSQGQLHDLGTLGGPNSFAVGINADGVVVGNSDEAEEMPGRGHQRRSSPFVYENGKMRPIRSSGKPPLPDIWTVRDLNNRGQLAIETKPQQGAVLSNGVIVSLGTFVPKGVGHQVGWKVARDGTRTPLILYNEGYTVPGRINDSGEVIGEAATPTGECSFLYSKGVLCELKGMYATDINATGQIVGTFRAKDGFSHACLCVNGKVTDLGVPPGFKDGRAEGINASGEIVGNGSTVVGGGFLWIGVDSRPFLYVDGHWIDLSAHVDLAGSGLKSLYDAKRINARGMIIGKAMGPGAYHGYLLTPVVMTARH